MGERTRATAVKALDDGGRVGGYLVVWGDPAQRDLQGEYFTPDTELGLDWYPRRPVLYHHGLDGDLGPVMIGQIESMQPDDMGVWVEAQLDMRSHWARAVWNLVRREALGWSSGSLPHLVDVAPDGYIRRWPVVEGSLTPTPAEPRFTDVVAVKAAFAALGLPVAALDVPSAALDVPSAALDVPSAALDVPSAALDAPTESGAYGDRFLQAGEGYKETGGGMMDQGTGFGGEAIKRLPGPAAAQRPSRP